MPTETRTRITILLPAPTTLSQFLLADQVITDLVLVCGGATYSVDIPPVYTGRWYNPNTHRPSYDDLIVIFGDVMARTNSSTLAYFLDQLKRRAQHDFSQDIIWITLHEIERVTTDDYRK